MVFSMKEFPAEVEIPTRCDYSERAAMMMASMSSCPGSQSSHIFFFSIRYILVLKVD